MAHASFENNNGSFAAYSEPFSINTPTTGQTYTMKNEEVAVYFKHAATIAALTVKLPTKPGNGDKILLAFKSAVTALTVQDGFAVAITGSPTTVAAGGAVELRWVNNLANSVGWVLADQFSPLAAGASAANALTAAGTTRTDALVLTKQVNRITTAGAGTGVVLPASASVGVGGFVVVFNAGANLVQVYGAGSDTIDGTAGSTGVALTNALRCIYWCVAANTFISSQLGVVSA